MQQQLRLWVMGKWLCTLVNFSNNIPHPHAHPPSYHPLHFSVHRYSIQQKIVPKCVWGSKNSNMTCVTSSRTAYHRPWHALEIFSPLSNDAANVNIQGCRTLIKIKFSRFSLWFPCILQVFPLFLSGIKVAFVQLPSPTIREIYTTNKECRSILRDEASVYFNVTAVHVWHLVARVYNPLYQTWLQWSYLTFS